MEAVASAGIDAGRDPKDAGFLPWVLGTLCALHRRPFDAALVEREFPPPHDETVLVHAAARLGFDARPIERPVEALSRAAAARAAVERRHPTRCCCASTANRPSGCASARRNRAPSRCEQLAAFYRGRCHLFKPKDAAPADPDAARGTPAFGFRWFVPELLKHRAVWRDVLLASLVIQLLALGHAAVHAGDHRQGRGPPDRRARWSRSASALACSCCFPRALTWVRQYLVLHTGNRIDAVLGSAGLPAPDAPADCATSSTAPPASSSRACTAWRPSANSSPAPR